MAEDWNAVAAEVDGALKSVASTDAGYPIALRSVVATGEGHDPVLTPSYATLHGVDFEERLRDQDGTLIGQTMRTLTVSATGPVPNKAQKVAPGVRGEDADEDSPWHEIIEVRPLAPAGVAVLYEIDVMI